MFFMFFMFVKGVRKGVAAQFSGYCFQAGARGICYALERYEKLYI